MDLLVFRFQNGLRESHKYFYAESPSARAFLSRGSRVECGQVAKGGHGEESLHRHHISDVSLHLHAMVQRETLR